MSAIKRVIFYWIVAHAFNPALTLEELPKGEDNDIIRTEAVVRAVTRSLFKQLRLLPPEKSSQKLREYCLIHNYFVSLTLQDYHSLKEIARFSRVDKNIISAEIRNYIVLLNEVLNDESDSLEGSDKDLNRVYSDDILRYIDGYLHSLDDLEKTGVFDERSSINKDLISILNKRPQLNNVSDTEKDDLLPLDEFWVPVPTESGRRIYNGRNTKAKYYPFMAAVLLFQQFQCGGSIIKNDLVLTAASCLQLAWNNRFFRENPAFLSVRIGSSFYESGGEEIAVMEVYFHPSYNPKNLHNNLAVMRLIRSIKFRKKQRTVKKISLDTVDSSLPTNTPGIVIVGWGSKTRTNIIKKSWENRLSFDILDIYPQEDCQDIYTEEYVTRRNFCAGYISKGAGACNRDVGGPGVVGGYLVGVVSFGSPACGTPDAPTVFTKVGFYYDWIEQIMEQDVPHQGKQTTEKHVRESPTPPSYLAGTEFMIQPVVPGETTAQPEYITEDAAIEVVPDLHGNVDISVFQDFLRTVFSNNDVDHYIDEFLDAMDGMDPLPKTELPNFNLPLSQIQKQPHKIKENKQEYAPVTQRSENQQSISKKPKHHKKHKEKGNTEEPQQKQHKKHKKKEKVKNLEPTTNVATNMANVEPKFVSEEFTETLDVKKVTLIEDGDAEVTTKPPFNVTDIPYDDLVNVKAKEELEKDLRNLIDNTYLVNIEEPGIDNKTLFGNTDSLDSTILELLYALDNETETGDFETKKIIVDEVRDRVLDLAGDNSEDVIDMENAQYNMGSSPTAVEDPDHGYWNSNLLNSQGNTSETSKNDISIPAVSEYQGQDLALYPDIAYEIPNLRNDEDTISEKPKNNSQTFIYNIDSDIPNLYENSNLQNVPDSTSETPNTYHYGTMMGDVDNIDEIPNLHNIQDNTSEKPKTYNDATVIEDSDIGDETVQDNKNEKSTTTVDNNSVTNTLNNVSMHRAANETVKDKIISKKVLDDILTEILTNEDKNKTDNLNL